MKLESLDFHKSFSIHNFQGVYNKTKCGVDMVDQIVSIHSSKRKVYKWWKSIFYYVLDLCIFNASILYFEEEVIDCKNIQSKMLYFWNKLIDEYFANKKYNPFQLDNEKTVYKEIHKHHFAKKIDKQRECKNCTFFNNGKKHSKETKWICQTCDVPLCIECFQDYHNRIDLDK